MIGVSYNTQAIKTDVNGKPIPQYYDALHDEYRPLQGEHGASRAVLYGPDGQPINSNNALPVSDQAVLTALTDGTQKVSVTGSLVTIGEDTFQMSGGDTLRGLAADKPAAADAHAAIPFCFYLSVDTGTVEVTTGTDWVVI